ncbi:MAG: hypothetical protein ACW98Y_11905 [Candidatus Thorarchaeota archaeon]|jgi:hypothetical protein
MKQYDTGMSTAMTSAIVIAIIVVSGLFAVTVFYPDWIPTTTPTTTTPTTPNGGFGIRAADYLNSRRGDVTFYWIFNCSFVNIDLTGFYSQVESSAFVDGVKMLQTEDGANIEVLFSPYDANIIGIGNLSVSQWENLGGSLVNTLDDLPDSDSIPELTEWYPTFNIGIHFNDGTFLAMQYFGADQKLDLTNGTWDGFTEWGWPDITSYDYTPHWLDTGGLLDGPIGNFYTSITENAPYPSA